MYFLQICWQGEMFPWLGHVYKKHKVFWLFFKKKKRKKNQDAADNMQQQVFILIAITKGQL